MRVVITCILASALSIDVVASSSGDCKNIKSSFYTTPFVADGYNSKVSWHLTAHNIPSAWQLSRGEGVTIGQVDTGIHKKQKLMKSDSFSSGLSAGRYIVRRDFSGRFSIGGWRHGTSVASVLSAPVNNVGAITGVAYRSNLISNRVNELPAILSRSASDKFANGLRNLARNPEVDIVNISMGSLSDRSSMRNAIREADENGKLLFASTGRFGDLLGTFPGKYEEVNAVTGVYFREEDPNGFDLQAHAKSPSGSYVEFAGYVERPSDGAQALVLDKKTRATCLGNGSSLASATMAGIAALVWSANPNLTREQVEDVMRESGSYANSPGRNVGFGVVDAFQAVTRAIEMGLPNNIAPQASVSVSSTYPGYSAQRMVDGDLDPRVGGRYSWTNDSGTRVSDQWATLTWSSPQRVSRVVVTTSENYELRDYDIWGQRTRWRFNRFERYWVVLARVRDNIYVRSSSDVARNSYNAIRILPKRGPNRQPQYGRINEVEVYN